MKTPLSVLIFFLLIVPCAYKQMDNAIHLDGVISEGEWKGAKEHALAGGGKVMMKKENRELYIAIVADKKAWAHAYLSFGDTVRVLHASAALGEAKYVKQNNLWRPVQSFTWELRDRIYNDELAKKQADYYRMNGWVANNVNTGNGMTFEFKFDLSRSGNNPTPFACLVSQIPLDIHYFPATLTDNTILPRLIQGYTPDSLSFDPRSWELIK